MNENLKIRNITPAVPGWWARFTNEDKSEWFSPVAAWALCDVRYSKQAATSEQILPVLTSDSGMAPLHPAESSCELIYLPESRFVLSDSADGHAWMLADDRE